MVKTLEELRAERDTLIRKRKAKESLMRLSRNRQAERKKLKSELSGLKNPKRKAAGRFVGAFFGEAAKLVASGARAATKPKKRKKRR